MIYAIADLHLALGRNKPMDIFGGIWEGYMEKIKTNWINTIKKDDTILIPGDISWATYLENAILDFQFLENLPGNKIISKGNHDYWWTTNSKLQKFVEENNFKTIKFMHNNNIEVDNYIICGTKGWKTPEDEDFSAEDLKIYTREIQRLEFSISSIDRHCEKDIIVAIHFPPFNSKGEPTKFVEILKRYNVKKCIYGHLHGDGIKNSFNGVYDKIEFQLVSADFLEFKPKLLI